MAEEVLTIESLKLDVRKSFAKVYSALKARELQTIRQIDAIWQQCGNNSLLALKRNCLQNIDISYENESSLFKEIHNFGIIDFKKLNIDSNIFMMEDYINPHNDHMYSYKRLEDDPHKKDDKDVRIEEDTFKHISQREQCLCYVNTLPIDVIKINKDPPFVLDSEAIAEDVTNGSHHSSPEISKERNSKECKSSEVDAEDENLVVTADGEDGRIPGESVQKMNPTQDWLEHIINEPETEPPAAGLMEHSTISCS